MTELYKAECAVNSEYYLRAVTTLCSVKQQLKRDIHAAIVKAICCGVESKHIELALKDSWEEYISAYSENIDDDEIPF